MMIAKHIVAKHVFCDGSLLVKKLANISSDEAIIIQAETLLEEAGEEGINWVVSDWLGYELVQYGAAVDCDFAGLIVWTRETSDQDIEYDDFIHEICMADGRW